jgi:hypothetical protein
MRAHTNRAVETETDEAERDEADDVVFLTGVF